MAKYVMSKAVGIDLGTTNSAVAVMKPTDTDIVIHRDATTKRETTPSCVWKDPRSGQVVVGRKAFMRIGNTPPPIRSIKRAMGKQTTVRLTNEKVTPEQVSASILSEMKQQIEEDVATFATNSTEWIVDRAIVTVPAYFDQPQIAATRKAAEMAGLQVLELLHEPTAAACYYCWQAGIQNGVFMVYDFGGGTFDVSILRCTAGTFEVLGISGNNLLGGDDIDTAIAEELQHRLQQQGYELDLDLKNDPTDRMRFDKLKLLAEGVKKSLSAESEMMLRDTAALRDKTDGWVEIEMPFERAEIEPMIRPIAERTLSYCYQALDLAQKKANVTLADIDAIILAGGTTHIPLVREIVRTTFCKTPDATGPRAKCTEPVYKKVDTIVALGAAIRAAATGGLTIYNPERTVRVSFKGVGATASKQTHIGGQVEALKPGIDLAGGHIRLTIAELGYEDEQPIKSGGSFGFTRVELQPSAENMLTFEIFDKRGKKIASVGRPISQSREALRPTGGSTGTANSPKGYYLDVIKAGKVARKELIRPMSTLPAREEFTFTHPGNTQLLRLPLYQNKKKIQDIKVPVFANVPKGTPINLVIEVDELSGIAVKGVIKDRSGSIPFDATLEIPAERSMPSTEEVEALEQAFQQVLVILPNEKKIHAEEHYKQAKASYDIAVKREDTDHAVHNFEEMEELVASSIDEDGPLQPPKDFFDKLVQECQMLDEFLSKAGQTRKAQELSQAIGQQQRQGEQAYASRDHMGYADTIVKLNALRDHMVMVLRQVVDYEDTRTVTERAADEIRFALEDADEVNQLALAEKRADLQGEIALIRSLLRSSAQDIQKNPQAVVQKALQSRTRLEQIKNLLIGSLGQARAGDLVEE